MTASTDTQARPTYHPELGALLDASPLPTTITAEMIDALRAVPFTAPMEEILATRSLDQTSAWSR
ncbi:hypothetical protein [Streptomyces sp. NBC_00568]|uniref:hypothetical protein n=1 Tax=Streptomyces sp. NBC_00568 TaxID=2975779 RepID=UPI00224F5886|nr:hypothetical protein [Streptomyces sp. NBC_00568]MCX4993596.1 hypothetical protein [Streptomyces sp. NBC_00568]